MAGSAQCCSKRIQYRSSDAPWGRGFREQTEWIYAAIRHSLRQLAGYDLDVRIISYKPPPRELLEFAAGLAF